MEKLPFKYRVLQKIADNYIFVLFLAYCLGIATGIAIEVLILLPSSNG